MHEIFRIEYPSEFYNVMGPVTTLPFAAPALPRARPRLWPGRLAGGAAAEAHAQLRSLETFRRSIIAVMKRIAAVLLVLAARSAAAQEKPAAPDPKINAFWAWFVTNSDELAKVKSGTEPICKTLSVELSKVEKGLTWEFGPTVNGVREFTVSADGAKALFPRVKIVAESAPVLPTWKILAFRQRKPIDGMSLKLDSAKLESSRILFRAVKEGEKVALSVYIEGMNGKNEKQVMMQGFILLDYSLGEFDVETRIGAIEFLPLSEKIDRKDLLPLPKLAAEVDRLCK